MNKKFTGIFQIGTIVSLILSSLAAFAAFIIIIACLFSLNIVSKANSSQTIEGINETKKVANWLLVILIVFSIIALVLNLVVVSLAAVTLKRKNTSLYLPLGIFGVLTHLIGGILVLCAENEDSNPQEEIKNKSE